MSLFESYERRIDQIIPVLNKYGIKDLDEAKSICDEKGVNVYEIVKNVQPICFENACWAYTVGAAIAIKEGCNKASEVAKITALFDKINKHTSVRLTWEAESSIDVGHIERIIQAAKPINANGCSLGLFVTAKNIQDIVGKGKSAKIRDQMIKDGYIVEVNEMQTRGAAFDAGILQSISNASKLYKINENRIQTTDDDDFVF